MPFELKMNVHFINQAHDAGIQAAVDKSAQEIIYKMKSMMQQPKSGRQYRRRQKSMNLVPTFGSVKTTAYLHTASAPGQAPAIDSADLFRSLRNEPTGEFERTVSAGTAYAFALEFGTSRMSPRPFFTPAFEQQKAVFRADLRKVFATVQTFA